jgi:hypothetical protein
MEKSDFSKRVQERLASPDEAVAAVISASKLRDSLDCAGEEYAKARDAGKTEVMQRLAIISALGAVDTFLSTALSPHDGLQARLMINDIASALAAASDWKTRKSATKKEDNAPHPLLKFTNFAGREMGISGLYKPADRRRALWGGLSYALIHDFGMSANEVRDEIGKATGAKRTTVSDWEGCCARDHANLKIAEISRRSACEEINSAGQSYSRDNPPAIDCETIKKLIISAQNRDF